MGDPELVLCAPCQSTGESLPAVKFCITCSESLCRTCVDFHMKFRSTKSHKLVDCSTQDSGNFKGAQLLATYVVCPDHDDSTVKVICEDHNVLCCLTCATITHRNCRHVSEINKLAVGCKTSGQTDKIRTRLEGAGICMQEIIDVNDACRMDFESSKEEIPQKLEQIKITFMKLFERMESAVMETVKNLHFDEDIAMGNREESWKLKLNANTDLLKMLDAIIEIGTESQVFVAFHKMKDILLETEKALEDQGSHIVGQRLNLKIKGKLESLMQTDVMDNLVAVESIQNQYQLPKTVAYSKHGHSLDKDIKFASDFIQDSETQDNSTVTSDNHVKPLKADVKPLKAESPQQSEEISHMDKVKAEAWSELPKHSTYTSDRFHRPDTPPTTKGYREFRTIKRGIRVFVYKRDILKLDVDCIVNAANKEMQHGGGVAKLIARAAGYELERASREYIKAFGNLNVGSCCSTTAGKLQYKRVIHTAGPDFNDYKTHQYPQMRRDLRQAVRVCFEEAERQNCKSIGMTSISSGVFGIPRQWCAEEYAQAVFDYSQNTNRSAMLTEIHFVDVRDEMLDEMNKTFQTVLRGTV